MDRKTLHIFNQYLKIENEFNISSDDLIIERCENYVADLRNGVLIFKRINDNKLLETMKQLVPQQAGTFESLKGRLNDTSIGFVFNTLAKMDGIPSYTRMAVNEFGLQPFLVSLGLVEQKAVIDVDHQNIESHDFSQALHSTKTRHPLEEDYSKYDEDSFDDGSTSNQSIEKEIVVKKEVQPAPSEAPVDSVSLELIMKALQNLEQKITTISETSVTNLPSIENIVTEKEVEITTGVDKISDEVGISDESLTEDDIVNLISYIDSLEPDEAKNILLNMFINIIEDKGDSDLLTSVASLFLECGGV